MFHLSRYFSIASLLGIVLVVLALSFYLRHQAMTDLLAQQSRSNIDLTKSYANAIWSKLDEYVVASAAWSPDEMR
jgi:hypothetical protein